VNDVYYPFLHQIHSSLYPSISKRKVVIRQIPHHLTNKPTACAVPCALGRTYRGGDWTLATNQSVISKQLPMQIAGNSFETSFHPGGGGM